jgi:hypothetical protein
MGIRQRRFTTSGLTIEQSSPGLAPYRDEIVEAGIAEAFYTGARSELIERLRLRDNALTLYLAGISAVGTAVVALSAVSENASLASDISVYLLLIIPVFASAAASVISQHHAMIGAIEAHLVCEFGRSLKERGIHLPQWDESRYVIDSKGDSIRHRSNSHRIIIFWTAVLALAAFVFLRLTPRPFEVPALSALTAPEFWSAAARHAQDRFLDFFAASLSAVLLIRARLIIGRTDRKRHAYRRDLEACTGQSSK